MSPEMIGVIGIIALLLLFMLRVPVAVSLIVVGTVGLAWIRGWDAAFVQLGTTPFSTASSYSLSVIPLFILMGMFLSYSGFGRDLYTAVDAWIGHIRGGLAMTTIGTSALFSAISGSVNATTATMARISLPEMKKYNYDDALSTSSVAAGGTLGILIPPSVILVLYGILTMEPIGKLLIAGILPGILQMVLFMLAIYFLVRRKPGIAPVTQKKPLSIKLRSLTYVWPFVLLFALSIGGIYFGYFTPTEAGGVGAFGAFILTIITRRLSWKDFQQSLSETTRLTAAIFFIIIGADIFSKFLALSTIPVKITQLVSGLALPAIWIMVIILFVYLILGLFLEGIAIFVLTLPVVYPLITMLGFDGVWFGVVMILVMNIGLLTPPMGLSVYIISGVAKDVPTQRIFKGVIPMLAMMVLCLILIVIFPEIVTFLPELMR
ncbi:TRAP transporter large permease [Ornithinibacillus halotolerans]|uniref:C4-dicarboxylate ABC transporter permease n=1 Tax=Ornithinibacillus halotolerans TaxID=1274357 RepID=A0A916S1H0_9BACI|nr:TRAP transporter large permease [Ornithinibacillus halotolerans]GGA78983.1 C4-dicarboxylate ABC transporter permease [Ornithinibacillus halotolerans]